MSQTTRVFPTGLTVLILWTDRLSQWDTLKTWRCGAVFSSDQMFREEATFKYSYFVLGKSLEFWELLFTQLRMANRSTSSLSLNYQILYRTVLFVTNSLIIQNSKPLTNTTIRMVPLLISIIQTTHKVNRWTQEINSLFWIVIIH